MAAVRVDPKAMTVTAQAGIRMGNLYYEIFRAGRAAGGRNLTCLGGTYPQARRARRPGSKLFADSQALQRACKPLA
jgi:hypothetical protein